MVQLSVLFLSSLSLKALLKPSHIIYKPLQLCTQKALMMAVNTVMVKLITFLIVSLFICSHFFLMVSYPFPATFSYNPFQQSLNP